MLRLAVIFLAGALVGLTFAVVRLEQRVDRDHALLEQLCAAAGHGESSIGPVSRRDARHAKPFKTGCAP